MEELSKKYLLSVNEAVEYFNLARYKIMELAKEPGCNFVNYVGKKTMINRQKFEEYLLSTKYL